ncbi:MAG: VTT domain-containing protein [Gammaproteobacteria bacterium]|nr:VTT domain-containing protein [Gammaproteobacteria bacterium]MDH3375127.1 VTT domain-containing protein [Gammaproteobacteria bacterium]MDH3410639.1 VTT domain-containing protein [Gammaproteobacteria bacterium]
MALRRNLRLRLLIVGTLIIAAGFIAASDTLHDKTEAIIFWTESLIAQAPLLGMLVFVLLAMISAMVAFFSSALLAPVAIYAWGQVGCLVLLWCGWFLGGIASFCIGRFFGRSVVSMIIGEEKIASWETQVSERSRFVHILFFQAVVPSEIPGYLLGILRYRFLLYLAALAITEIPYAIATVYLGESFLEGDGTAFILVGIGVIVLAAFMLQIRRRLDRPGKQ